MKKLKNINMILFMLENKTSRELDPVLEAAFKEVEKFYNLGLRRANFRFNNLSIMPQKVDNPIISAFDSFFSFGKKKKEKDDFSEKKISMSRPTSKQIREVRGRVSGTFDALKISDLVKQMLPIDEQRNKKVIVIDRELTPPRNYRYIIWSRGVISTLPVDPRYWGNDVPNRISIIKHRVRTACLSIVGTLIGLGKCKYEDCFLYRNVDSVVRLDRMVKLGPEHRIPELAGKGFDIEISDPRRIQPVVMDPKPGGDFYFSE